MMILLKCIDGLETFKCKKAIKDFCHTQGVNYIH